MLSAAAALAALVLGSSTVSAGSIAGDTIFPDLTYNLDIATGFEFTPNQNIIVTHLGIYDHGAAGFASSHDVALFAKSNPGVALTSTTLGAGLSGTFVPGTVAGTRFVGVAPVVLTAGTSYYILGNNFQIDGYTQGRGVVIFDSAIAWNGIAFGDSNSVNSVPFFNDFTSGNLGPNFMFTTAPIPEPSSLALLGMGVAGLGGYRWRRKRQTVA